MRGFIRSVAKKVGLLLFGGCIMTCVLIPSVFATSIGDSKPKIEQKYGAYCLVQDAEYRIWKPDEWKLQAKGIAKAYGYRDTEGGLTKIIWIEYNKQNQVSKETVTMDSSIKIRDLKKYFGELYTEVIASDSAVFIITSLSKEQVGVIVQTKDHKFRLIRFFMDRLHDDTTINMHSKIRSFEIVEISASEANKYLKVSKSGQVGSKSDKEFGNIEGNWIRTDNYFQDKLFFSEKLVPRKETDMIVIHHTAIENMSTPDIHELHLLNGWAGIGYHKVILPDGTIENGRPEDMIGAHALGVNPHSIGISLVGNFELGHPSVVQMKALEKLTLELMQTYHISLTSVVPHRAVTQGTSCPGILFPWEQFMQGLILKSSKTG